MSTLHTRGYKESRKWSDGYESHMNQISAGIMYHNNLMGVYFVLPTLYQDRQQGIDMHVVTETIKFSHRVRKASALPYFYKGFTIRTTAYKHSSELDKVMSGNYADYLVYGIADPDEYGVIAAAVMVDMKGVGAQLVADPSILKEAHIGPGFVEFKYSAFPEPVVVGTYGIDDKGEVCQ